MIIVELTGGLGNQLFQFAAGFSLSRYHNVELKMNADSFQKPDPVTGTKRRLELAHFSYPIRLASSKEIGSFLERPFIIEHTEKLLPFHKRSVYKEKKVTYDPAFFKAGNNLYLKGNRQSEKYFKPYEEELRSALEIKSSSIDNIKEFSTRVRNHAAVAIHIRRGDYLTNVALDVLGLMTIEYYQQAIVTLIEKTLIDHIYVFSDDMKWAYKNLNLPIETTYVSDNITKSSIEDFHLISQCKHQIIANSTFSWWAAWLNPNPDKIVIAPKKWFNNAPYDTRDLIPESWITL